MTYRHMLRLKERDLLRLIPTIKRRWVGAIRSGRYKYTGKTGPAGMQKWIDMPEEFIYYSSKFLSRFKTGLGDTVLDIGCGNCYLLWLAKSVGADVIGVDRYAKCCALSDVMASVLGVKTMAGTVKQDGSLPECVSGRYSRVFAIGVCWNVNWERFYENCIEMLLPGGIFAIQHNLGLLWNHPEIVDISLRCGLERIDKERISFYRKQVDEL